MVLSNIFDDGRMWQKLKLQAFGVWRLAFGRSIGAADIDGRLP
jgi:hypothetical protein